MAELKRPVSMPWRSLVSLRIAAGKVVVGLQRWVLDFLWSRGADGASGVCWPISPFLPATLRIQQHHLLVAGGAAGIAAAFNASGRDCFAIEELSRNVESRMSGVVITRLSLAR